MTPYADARTVDFDEIPMIDLTGLEDPRHSARIARDLVDAAQTCGFFYLEGHGIDPAIRAAAFDGSARFFDRPEAEKALVAVDQNQRGWMGVGASNLEGSRTHDAKEVFFWGRDIAADDPDLGQPMVAHNRWPDGLRADIEPYYLAVVALGRRVMAALATGLGADPAVFEAAYQRPLARGQLVYYPPVTDADKKAERFSAAAHTDFGVLTLLAQDDTGGLQVRNRSGDWIAAPPVPDTFVCNIGDLLQHWTGGRLVSTLHRVQNTSGKARYSIPVFHDPASTSRIDPRDLFPDDPAQPRVTAGAYIAAKNRRNFAHYDRD